MNKSYADCFYLMMLSETFWLPLVAKTKDFFPLPTVLVQLTLTPTLIYISPEHHDLLRTVVA
jgi:hypothetical protein